MHAKNEITPILLLTGYLGSGKTTLVNHILSNQKGIRFAVIVNDIGEVNIDADLIQKGGIVNAKDDSLVALQNGCICCTLKMDLIKQIDDILEMKRFDYIVIEASGICEPAPIAQTICSIPRMKKSGPTCRLDCITTVVDALRLQDEFACGDSLTKKDIGEEDIERLIIEQIEFCNLILLNKASEVTKEELARIKQIIRTLQPKAEIIECDYGKVDLDVLIDTHRFNFERTATSAGWVRELENIVDEDEDEDDHDEHHHDEHHHDEHHHDEHHHDEDEHDHHHHDEDEHDHHHHDDDDDDDDDHDHEHEHGHHHHHHHHGEGEVEEYGIQTFVYYRRPAFDIHKFDRFVSTQWSKNIIRAKGVCYFSNNPDMSFMFEQAGRQKQIKEAGLWYATAPEEELIQIMREEPGLLKDWDDQYGDRMVKIVFIGQHLDKEEITKQLDACLAR
jgi:G3E family GTPase